MSIASRGILNGEADPTVVLCSVRLIWHPPLPTRTTISTESQTTRASS